VSEQNLLPDESGEPLRHPQINEFFDMREGSGYVARDRDLN
jgi:heat shock protein HspQ